MKLLTREFGNPKLGKSSFGNDWVVCGLHLAPHSLSNYNVCPASSKGCRAACLNVSGRGKCHSVQDARIAKTKLWFENRRLFKNKLIEELHYFCARCAINGWKPACRLNLTSDIVWEKLFPELFAEFPNVQFYDYTKLQKRFKDWYWDCTPPNYHLTFSKSESNDNFCRELTNSCFYRDINLAVVFENPPKEFLGRQVIVGDYSDLRFLDPLGVVIGLSPKGRAIRDQSGFVVR